MKEKINFNKESKEEIKPEIVLHFFRHSKKESKDIDDNLIRLTEEGRKLAKEKSFSDVDLDQSIAFGSPRLRTQETAILMMAGKEDEITGDETLEELKEKINKDLNFGSKLGIDKRLDYKDDLSSFLGKKTEEAFNKGEYLDFLINESDKISKETNDKTSSNYSAKASQIANIIRKYIHIMPRWGRLVKDGSYDTKLERFMSTHASVPESFLLKVMEITDDKDSMKDYLKEYPNGVGYLDGLDVQITNRNNQIGVTIFYKVNGQKRQKEITLEVLDLIASQI